MRGGTPSGARTPARSGAATPPRAGGCFVRRRVVERLDLRVQQLLREAVAAHVARHEHRAALRQHGQHRVAAVEPLEFDAAGLVRDQRVEHAPEAPAAPARRRELRRAHLRREGGAATHLEIGDAHERAAVVVARRQPEEQIGDDARARASRASRRASGRSPRARSRGRASACSRELRRGERREPLERRRDRAAARVRRERLGEGARSRIDRRRARRAGCAARAPRSQPLRTAASRSRTRSASAPSSFAAKRSGARIASSAVAKGADAHARLLAPRPAQMPWISCSERTPIDSACIARIPPAAARTPATVVKYGTPRISAARRIESESCAALGSRCRRC